MQQRIAELEDANQLAASETAQVAARAIALQQDNDSLRSSISADRTEAGMWQAEAQRAQAVMSEQGRHLERLRDQLLHSARRNQQLEETVARSASERRQALPASPQQAAPRRAAASPHPMAVAAPPYGVPAVRRSSRESGAFESPARELRRDDLRGFQSPARRPLQREAATYRPSAADDLQRRVERSLAKSTAAPPAPAASLLLASPCHGSSPSRPSRAPGSPGGLTAHSVPGPAPTGAGPAQPGPADGPSLDAMGVLRAKIAAQKALLVQLNSSES